MSAIEPPKPERGQTSAERGRDVSPAQAEAEARASFTRRSLAAAKPGYVLSQADGYPPGVKQFLQFCLVIVYPAFAFMALLMLVLHAIWVPIEWVLLLPIRVVHRRRDPEGYERIYGRTTL